ncbi:helix-turn-helix domain-containing protein [Actinokineospora inagensis]|uniref:helix-turn-helix domain-containing protein n=1 Tax=Actinokineospora inagensis TaxID=103730 RepID=UPI0009FF2C17|nr:helix-turn-helix domain-containing protein [Actinokineospora inagensis]
MTEHATHSSSTAVDAVTDKPATRPLLLRVEDAAALLSIGRTRVYDLLRTGQLTSVKIFGARRIPLAEVEEYIKVLVQQARALQQAEVA